MKSRKSLFYHLHAVAFAVVAFAMSSSAQAQSWDGGGVDASWGTPENWDSDTLPSFGTTADLSFPTTTGLTSGTNTFLGVGRQVRSLTFGADVDSAIGVILSTNTTTLADARLTFADPTGNSINVLNGSTGDINIGNPTNIGSPPAVPASTLQTSGNLTVNHNGTGLLTFSRPISTASALNFTKTGTGTLQSNNNNLITGTLNVDGGRLIANAFTTAGDFNAVSSINLGGGALQYNTTSAGNKTVSPALNVTSNSVLAFNNTDTVNRSLNFTGTNAFSLGSGTNLTVQTISANTALQNIVNISRNVSGSGSMIVEGFNNINSATTSFLLGRIVLGGTNTLWTGSLDIKKGTAEIYGTAANLDDFAGNISIGDTGNSFGAGLLLSPSANANIAFTNAITVRSGGFRTIRSGISTFATGSDTFYTFSGPLTLDGNLNIHADAINADRRMVIGGNISGTGELSFTRGNSGFLRLTGDNSGWSGNLVISNGTVNFAGTSNTSGTGDIVFGTTGNALAASLNFSPTASITYSNDIIVNTGGSRTIAGNSGSAFNVTFSGGVTLNGDLTLDHSWSTADRRIALSGPISGNGGLTITRSAGSLATTSVLSGVSNYTGPTIVASTASLAVSSAGFLASNITVQSGARLGGGGGTSGNLTMDDGSSFFFFYSPTYVPFDVNGTVTVSNPSTFGITSLVGGSQGEAVPWATIPDDTYTLIGTTASTFNGINNFGLANAIANIGGSGKTVYFQNGGGTSGGGLQLVVTTASVDPYTTWSGGAPFDADSNNDGVDNGLAWFLGAANKDEIASELLPEATQTAGVLVLDFDCLNATDRGPAIFHVQYSNDLGQLDPWAETAVPGMVGSFTSGVVDFVVTDPGAPGGLLKVVATIPAGESAAGKLFGRVNGLQ